MMVSDNVYPNLTCCIELPTHTFWQTNLEMVNPPFFTGKPRKSMRKMVDLECQGGLPEGDATRDPCLPGHVSAASVGCRAEGGARLGPVLQLLRISHQPCSTSKYTTTNEPLFTDFSHQFHNYSPLIIHQFAFD